MKHYFYDQVAQNLLILDADTGNLQVTSRLKVRVIFGLSDLEDNNKRAGELTSGARRVSNHKRSITCKKCGRQGHQARKCSISEGSKNEDSDAQS
jgi:hypothetical protein